MKALQKAGGVGALLLALSFVLLIVNIAVISPSLGISGADADNPAKVFAVAPAARLLFSIPILFAVAFTLVALGLNDRLQESAPALMRIATAAGLGGAILFLAAGMFAWRGLPILAGLYAQSPAAVTTTDLVLGDAISDGLLTAGIFAAGWFALLASWTALRGGLSKILSYLGLAFGAASILGFAIPLGPIGIVLGVVWGIWLGIVLWRS